MTNLCVRFIHVNYASQLKSHKFSIAPYIIMHKMLEHMIKNRILYQEARFDEFAQICHAHKMSLYMVANNYVIAITGR